MLTTTDCGVRRGPARIDSDRYQISAKAGDAVSKEMINLPMLRALLEERFRLKFHRETREVPIYSLTVAKERPQTPTVERRELHSQGSIAALGVGNPGEARLRASSRPTCPGGPWRSLPKLSACRMVIDQTGITEKFDFQVEYAPDGADLSDELTAPSIDSVLGNSG